MAIFGESDKNVCYNITKYIKTLEKTRIMSALGCDEKYINGNASDFEWFDEWERILPLCEGHREHRKYADELSDLGFGLPLGEYSRERSIERWREVNGDRSYDLYEKRQSVELKKRGTEALPRANGARTYDINKYVSDIANDHQTLSELSKHILKELAKDENADITLKIELSCLEYLRPDPYLSGRCYSRYKCDEKLNCSELFAMYTQVLTELLAAAKGRNILLNIMTDGDISASCELLRYLHSRRLFCGRVHMRISADTDTDKLYELLERVYPDIYVSPVIELKGITHEELTALYYRYPQGSFVTVK